MQRRKTSADVFWRVAVQSKGSLGSLMTPGADTDCSGVIVRWCVQLEEVCKMHRSKRESYVAGQERMIWSPSFEDVSVFLLYRNLVAQILIERAPETTNPE